ncbi:MAG: purine-nucleoside phosphorylase [Deltaproteobacteria bacterium]|nr:purine-nucleoside phosphorylase [Deltaproteobacteria bacterium]
MSRFEKLDEALTSLKSALTWERQEKKPTVAVVLGSGLGAFVETLKHVVLVDYDKVKGMPPPTVAGHGGKWALGVTQADNPVLVAMGRYHYYEGHSSAVVTLPVQLMKGLGIQHIIMTNATGSVNPQYRPGEYMLIRDHINLMGRSPLEGLFGRSENVPFIDMSQAYDLPTIERIYETLQTSKLGTRVHSGVYCGVLGPQFETPSEIQMIARMGGDVVGMSTVPEVIMARYLGMKVNGVSSITNYGSGLGTSPLSHDDVTVFGRTTAVQFSSLVNLMIDIAYKYRHGVRGKSLP